jgi:hypothetical protein
MIKVYKGSIFKVIKDYIFKKEGELYLGYESGYSRCLSLENVYFDVVSEVDKKCFEFVEEQYEYIVYDNQLRRLVFNDKSKALGWQEKIDSEETTKELIEKRELLEKIEYLVSELKRCKIIDCSGSGLTVNHLTFRDVIIDPEENILVILFKEATFSSFLKDLKIIEEKGSRIRNIILIDSTHKRPKETKFYFDD